MGNRGAVYAQYHEDKNILTPGHKTRVIHGHKASKIRERVRENEA